MTTATITRIPSRPRHSSRPCVKSRHSIALVAPAVLAVFLALACADSGPDSDPSRAQIRDSADIRIVENQTPPEASRLDWRIGPEPTVSIGEMDGEEPYLLSGAGDGTRLSDGRIVVVNRSTNELRVFDARGTHVATWGGTGEGPGEFTELGSVHRWPADSIAAWTAARLGISVLASDGSFGRTFRMAGDGRESHGRPLWIFFTPVSVTRDGSVLTLLAFPNVDTLVVELRDGEGRTTANFGTHPSWEPHRVTLDGRNSSHRKIFGREPVHGIWGDRIVIGSTAHYELKAFRADASLERIVRRAHVPRAPTPADIAAYIDQSVPQSRPGMSDADLENLQRDSRRRLESVPVAEHFPVFTSIMSDALDHLWVEEYEFPGEERAGSLWTVFDPKGRVLGFVETPEGLWIWEIGEDYILGRADDELGVESVQVWPLERTGG